MQFLKDNVLFFISTGVVVGLVAVSAHQQPTTPTDTPNMVTQAQTPVQAQTDTAFHFVPAAQTSVTATPAPTISKPVTSRPSINRRGDDDDE